MILVGSIGLPGAAAGEAPGAAVGAGADETGGVEGPPGTEGVVGEAAGRVDFAVI